MRLSLSVLNRAALLCGLATPVLQPGSLAAQSPIVTGIARDAKLRTPLECLHVALIDTSGRAVAHAVTDGDGMFALVTPNPGVYRVRFKIDSWEPLVGPVETLAIGDVRERAYPLEFTREVGLEATVDDIAQIPKISPTSSRSEMEEANRRAAQSLRAHSVEGSWRSALPVFGASWVKYPTTLRSRNVSGHVSVQYIIQSDGRAQVDKLRVIEESHREFADAVREGLPRRRWEPATNDGQAVCQLVRERIGFDVYPTRGN